MHKDTTFDAQSQDLLLDAALDYAKRGWPVFPVHGIGADGFCTCSKKSACDRPGKHPLTDHGFKDATTDSAIIAAWWDKWPLANVAIRTGRASGIVSIDCDGVQGRESFSESFPDESTCHFETGRLDGGIQYVYAYPKEGGPVKSGTKFLPGVDSRGDGGYIVAPPSLHVSGKRYRWMISPDKQPPADLPSFALDLINRKNGHEKIFSGAAQVDFEKKIPDGVRNNALFRFASLLRRYGVAEDLLFTTLQGYRNANCENPDEVGDDELAKIVKSVLRYPADENIGKEYDMVDDGNAARLADAYRDELRYCSAFGSWLIWNGKCWEKEDDLHVVGFARKAIDTIRLEAELIADADSKKEKLSYANKCRSLSKIRAMLELAKSRLLIGSEKFDQDVWLLNCENGTLDLKTGEFREHRPDDYITKIAPVVYDPSAQCPLWLKFLDRIMDGDSEMLEYLQKIAGLSLTGDVSSDAVFILYGTGANGKSVLLKTVGSVMGPYAKQMAAETLLVKKYGSIPNDLAMLKGARLVTAVETGDGKRLAESLVKQLSGGDSISARFLYGEYFQFTPTFKIFLATNFKPIIHEDDLGIWRRIKLIPFEVTIPESERDLSLRERLAKEESPGILNWMVEGCRKWRETGLVEPRRVKSSTESYRQEMDIVARFLGECCDVASEARIAKGELYGSYKFWADANGLKPMSNIKFGQKITEKGFQSSEKSTNGLYFWLGVRLSSGLSN